MGTLQNFVDNVARAAAALCELASNKATNFSTVNDTLYPSVQAVKSYADALVVGLLDDRGSYDASANVYPSTGGSGTAGAILKGDLWYISVSGVLGGSNVYIGDTIRALVDSPGQTAANWDVMQYGLSYVPENISNKATGFATVNDILYPSVKAVSDYVATAAASFPSGTRMLFQQSTAPTGWTKDTSAALNDSILRVVTGTVGSGGSNAFSTFNGQTSTAAYTLTTTDIPSHSHAVTDPGHSHTINGQASEVGAPYSCFQAPPGKTPLQTVVGNSATTGITIGNTGGGGGHSHGITTAIKYNDIIIATKN